MWVEHWEFFVPIVLLHTNRGNVSSMLSLGGGRQSKRKGNDGGRCWGERDRDLLVVCIVRLVGGF